MPIPQTQHVALQGTLDLVTPPIAKSPSHAITADNVQPLWGGGFGRIEGYEPVDGAPAPSDHIYYRVVLARVDPAWVGGEAMLNGKKGFITAVDAPNTSLRVVAVKFEGNKGDTVTVTPPSGSPVNAPLQLAAPFGVGNNADEQAKLLAATHRFMFGKVTKPLGDGILRGVVDLDGQLTAFRDNGNGLAISVGQSDHRWSAAPDVFEVTLKAVVDPDAFTIGANVLVDGVSAQIYAATFAANGQTGVMYIDKAVNANADIDVAISGATQATTAGAMNKAAYSSGKPWKFVYHNFYASSNTRYAYGTNGDKVVEVRPNGVIIPVPVNDPRPITDIEVHHNHLFVAFEGGQYGHCAVGEPLNWEVLLGAEQFGTGDEITALQSMPGGQLLIGCENSVFLLSGSTRQNWASSRLSKVGITKGTLTSTFNPVAHSTNGFINVTQTQAFGDFIASEIYANRLLGDEAFRHANFFAYSHKKEHNQIRFYQRGRGKHFVVQLLANGKNRATFFSYPKPLEGVWDTDDQTYLAFDDGMIYRQNRKICSFAGSEIYWVLHLAYTHTGSPNVVKSWESFELLMSSEGSLKIKFVHSLDYGSMKYAQSRSVVKGVFAGGGRWDEAQWDEFFWSSPDYITPTVYLSGHSKNISLLLSGRSDYEQNFKLDGYMLSYIPRRKYRA